MFKKAIRWGVVSGNPRAGVERFSEKPRRRCVEDAEYLAFSDFAGPLLAAYMDFKLLTGLCRGDILAIRLAQLREDGIHIRVAKTNKPLIIEWSNALNAAETTARRLPRPVTGLYLFSTRKGQPYTSSGFSSIWQRKMRRHLRR